MPTLGELIDEVVSQLSGYTTDVPAMGTLAGDVTATSNELAIDFGDTPGAARPNGVIEIGSELMVVSQYDANTGRATVPPWGRGHAGTVAIAHDAGAKVTVRPRFPRKRVAQTINQVVASSCPPLFAARDLEPIETGAWVPLGFELPADTIRVLRVDTTDLGPEMLVDRRIVRDWTVRSVAGTQMLELSPYESMQTIQVTVAANPGKLVGDDDDFAAVTGLSESAADMVIFGALARLSLSGELARQQVSTVEANSRSEKVPAGSGTTISRYFQALYTQRLEAERDRLQHLHPLTLLRRG